MENFINEVKSKLRKRTHYESKLYFQDCEISKNLLNYDNLIENIDIWLKAQNLIPHISDSDLSESERFIKEVEEKIELRKTYKMMMLRVTDNSSTYKLINELQKEIKSWLKEQVDLDLPVYVDRLTYAGYLKLNKDNPESTTSNEDKIAIPPYNDNPQLEAKIICDWGSNIKNYKLDAQKIENMSDIITIFELLDIKISNTVLKESNIEPNILEKLFNYKGE